MAQKRKLQVFVSSTYTDLVGERQTAVEAILTAGHIPAGMELFAGQNEEQMNIIKEWIDESDIYLLILGGRYGSIDETTKKSYTHLEYEYAKQSGKVIFAVVAHDDYINNKVFKNNGKPDGIIELDYRSQYTEFKNSITGKYVKYWTSDDSLKLAIINTLHVLERDEKLIGWVPGNEVTNTGAIAEELARLTKENAELRLQVSSSPKDQTKYSGLTFDEMYVLLNQDEIDVSAYKPTYVDCLTSVATAFGDYKVGILHILWVWMNTESYGVLNPYNYEGLAFVLERLKESRLVELVEPSRAYTERCRLTSIGKEFFLKLKLTRDTNPAYDAVKELKEMDQHAAGGQFVPYET